MESLRADHVLDCYGLVCPMPVRKTARALEAMPAGHILQVIATDDWFGPDLEAWLQDQPHRLLGLEEDHGEISAFIRKGGGTPGTLDTLV